MSTQLKKLEKQLKCIEEIKALECNLIDLHEMCKTIVLGNTKSAIRVRISAIGEVNDDSHVLFDGDGSLTKPVIVCIEIKNDPSTHLMS